jgi:deazaflavin-dependent oxidoreductase (nitroreductase family)
MPPTTGALREMATLSAPQTEAGTVSEIAGTTRIWFMRRFTTHLFNPGSLLFFGRLPGCGILTHLGRTSGRRYRVPVFVLRRGDDYVFALTYGSESHWVKNILAAGGVEMRVRGRELRLVEPEVFVDKTRRLMPLPYRLAGRAVHATEFLSMRAG